MAGAPALEVTVPLDILAWNLGSRLLARANIKDSCSDRLGT